MWRWFHDIIESVVLIGMFKAFAMALKFFIFISVSFSDAVPDNFRIA